MVEEKEAGLPPKLASLPYWREGAWRVNRGGARADKTAIEDVVLMVFI